MNQDTPKPYQKYELLLRLIEGDLNDAGLAELERWFGQPGAVEAYWEFVKNYTAVKICEESRLETADGRDGSDNLLSADLWQALATDEKTAPEIPVPRPVLTREPEEPKAAVPASPRRVSRLSIYTLIVSSAAIVLLVAYAHLVSLRRGIEVATLQDSWQAKWADAEGTMKSGNRLATHRTFCLRGGIAALKFDNNAAVTIEGPAEFEIVSEDRIKLGYGRLYSIVPQEALGFSVVTPTATVVDLGTQFGVQVDFNGTTELHVNKGLTRLLAGDKQRKVSLEAQAGSAWRVSKMSSEAVEIPCEESRFVRQINSKANVIWRGQKTFSLADLVGGGNGWGTGLVETALDPLTGKRGGYRGEDRQGPGEYRTLPSERYIDGIFVPDGSKPQVVSSQGHLFRECPPTNNIFYVEVVNGSAREVPLSLDGVATCLLGGRPFGTPEYPAIFMHANLGITFDLQAIRQDLPQGLHIRRFTSDVGIGSDIRRTPNAEIWVLVDGEVRFRTRLQDASSVVPIQVALSETDRFLTLVSTDGGDEDHPEQPGARATDSDWCVFGEPKLEF